MPHKNTSILLLGIAVLAGTLKWHPGFGILMSILSVVYFWWAHGFRLVGANLRILGLLLSGVTLFWYLGGNLGFTGIQGLDPLPSEYEFDPSELRRLKKSNRVALRLALDHPPTEEERYLRLGSQKPAQLVSGTDHASIWANEHLTGLPLEHKIQTLREWFSGEFRYSLDSEWSTLDSFLFETKQGYCQHFSFSAHQLLTLSGEKVQMVFGYSGGSWNPVFRTLTYLDSDAHSWLEVWDGSVKSIQRIDPTTWVTRMNPESRGFPHSGAPLKMSLGLIIAFACGVLFFLLRDPRGELARILATREPISEALKQHALKELDRGDIRSANRIENIKNEYETLYFSGRFERSPIRASIFSLLLQTRIFRFQSRRLCARFRDHFLSNSRSPNAVFFLCLFHATLVA